MSEKELLHIVRDLLGFAIHGNNAEFQRWLKVDLRKIEEALHEMARDADGAD